MAVDLGKRSHGCVVRLVADARRVDPDGPLGTEVELQWLAICRDHERIVGQDAAVSRALFWIVWMPVASIARRKGLSPVFCWQ